MSRVIIIGAGIAGLTTGIFARKNGFDVNIFESHSLPGGMCTAWKRKGFLFEGCFHYINLTGTSQRHNFYDLWKNLGVFPQTQIHYHDIFHTFRDNSGRTLNLFSNADKLKKELLAFSPEDAKEIIPFCKAIKYYAAFLSPMSKNPLKLLAKTAGMIRAFPLLIKYGSMNLAEFADRFKAPLIRDALKYLFVQSEFACTSVFFILAGYHIRSAGFPAGGSLSLAKKLESRLLELNGKIHYRKKVKRIIVENDKATGVELFDGSEHKGDIIISAADGYSTLFNMLEDKYTTPELRERFEKESLYTSFIQVSLGVNRDMTNEPHSIKVKTDQLFEIAGQMRDELWYHHLAFDATMAPKGKVTLIVHYPSDYEWWEKITYNSSEYKSEKQKILEITIAQLEKILPGISGQIEISDVATPYTINRYTSNWKAVPGFSMTKTLAGKMTLNPQYCLPKLKNFYMTGQWVKGFGVPMGAMCGKEVIQKVCKDEKVKFKV